MFHIFDWLKSIMNSGILNPFHENSMRFPVIKMAQLDCLCCEQTCDVRTGQFSLTADCWLVNSNFRGTSCMQGCLEHRKIKVRAEKLGHRLFLKTQRINLCNLGSKEQGFRKLYKCMVRSMFNKLEQPLYPPPPHKDKIPNKYLWKTFLTISCHMYILHTLVTPGFLNSLKEASVCLKYKKQNCVRQKILENLCLHQLLCLLSSRRF